MSFFRSIASSSRLVPSLSRAYASPARPTMPELLDLSGAGASSTPANTSSPLSNDPKQLDALRKYARLDEDAWKTDDFWKSLSGGAPTDKAQPGNQYSGRSIDVRGAYDVAGAFKRLSMRLARSGLRQDVRRSEYHERPSEKKRRLASERHRRRFQEMVREKVQTVQMIRNRG